jgi:hypothetical protein
MSPSATGERQLIPMRNNAYAVEASRAKYPLRLVAYDAADRVIGVKTLRGDAGVFRVLRPRPGARWRRLIRDGTATLWVAPGTRGGTCFAVRYAPTSGGMTACLPPGRRGPALQLGASTLGTETVWVSGRVRDDVATVLVVGRRVRPVDGFVLAAVPARRPLRARALGADGHVVARTVLLH